MRDGAPYFPLFLDSFDRYTPGSLYPACAIPFPPFSCIMQNPDWTWFDGMVHWNISRIHVHHTVIRFLDLTAFGFCFEDFDLVAASRISYKMGVFCITRPKIRLISQLAIKSAVTSFVVILSSGLTASLKPPFPDGFHCRRG